MSRVPHLLLTEIGMSSYTSTILQSLPANLWCTVDEIAIRCPRVPRGEVATVLRMLERGGLIESKPGVKRDEDGNVVKRYKRKGKQFRNKQRPLFRGPA